MPAQLADSLRRKLCSGMVIPAHPLALDASGRLAERHQRALTRYYCAAGAGGIAVAVHTTQFEIREPAIGLHRVVLELAAHEVDAFIAATGRPVLKIAGICGPTVQAVQEAVMSRELGYDLGLVSLTGLFSATNRELIAHLQRVGEELPIMGFYLQQAVGGRYLDYAFWRRAAELESLVAIKIAPFNRYHTLEVIRAVADAGRAGEIALYTGNDDNIVMDLLTPFAFHHRPEQAPVHFAGGLLGQWAIWTKRAVELLDEIHALRRRGTPIPPTLLTLAQQITDCNQALFDAQNRFRGCIAGILEVLRRQGLVPSTRTLPGVPAMSPGQIDEIDRVMRNYPHLNDDDFVAKHRDAWLA